MLSREQLRIRAAKKAEEDRRKAEQNKITTWTEERANLILSPSSLARPGSAMPNKGATPYKVDDSPGKRS